jgi:hypothetical protein
MAAAADWAFVCVCVLSAIIVVVVVVGTQSCRSSEPAQAHKTRTNQLAGRSLGRRPTSSIVVLAVFFISIRARKPLFVAIIALALAAGPFADLRLTMSAAELGRKIN